jgi:acyl carrier protein
MSDYRAAVQKTVRELGFEANDGTLVSLDSLMIVELVMALERETGLEIPIEDDETFVSIDSVATMLSQL